jgi:hypothetical protein
MYFCTFLSQKVQSEPAILLGIVLSAQLLWDFLARLWPERKPAQPETTGTKAAFAAAHQ